MGEARIRATEKNIEIMGRNFVIKKLDARTSCYIVTKFTTKILPFGLQTAMGMMSEKQAAINGPEIGMDEFFQLQNSILTCVNERLAGGIIPIIDKAGNFAVLDMEDNGALVMRLTIDALQFNFSDFFVGNLWKSLLPEELSLMLSELLTSVNFSSHPLFTAFGGNTKPGTEPTT